MNLVMIPIPDTIFLLHLIFLLTYSCFIFIFFLFFVFSGRSCFLLLGLRCIKEFVEKRVDLAVKDLACDKGEPIGKLLK